MRKDKEELGISGRNGEKRMRQEKYQEVILFDIPALFENGRVTQAILPDGIYSYDLRGYDSDPGWPYAVEEKVMVNHAGTILTAVPLSLSENGYLRLGEEMDFTGGMASIQEYQEKMKSRKLPNEIEKAENAIGRADEFLILGGQADRYAIYQIDETSKAKEYMFMCFEFLTSHGMSVDGADYQYIYGGRLLGQETLESLFERFNLRHPENYGGHSLSISDVVVQRDKHTEAYYVDSIGYIQLPDFISQRKEYVEKLYKRQDMLVNE
jgi:hypothetical protein